MAQPPSITPEADRLTNNERYSMLEGFFNTTVQLDNLRRSVLQNLNNDDFNSLRRTSRRMNAFLITPTATQPPGDPTPVQGPRDSSTTLRHQADLIDTCSEAGLPRPPALEPFGTCPNPPNTQTVTKPCRGYRPRHSPNHLVCAACRSNNHHNAHINGIKHDHWRRIIHGALIPVCFLCDRSQRALAGTDGFDGCICYRERYLKDCLCVDCDDRKRLDYEVEADNFTTGVYSLRLITGAGNNRTMTINPTPYRNVGGPALCPCGRAEAMEKPWPIPTSQWHGNGYGHPFHGNQHVGMMKTDQRYYKRIHTHICAMCCGYVVPVAHPDPTDVIDPLDAQSMARSDPMVLLPRRSVRVRNRRVGISGGEYVGHVMLNMRGRMSRFRVTKKGFESQVVRR